MGLAFGTILTGCADVSSFVGQLTQIYLRNYSADTPWKAVNDDTASL